MSGMSIVLVIMGIVYALLFIFYAWMALTLPSKEWKILWKNLRRRPRDRDWSDKILTEDSDNQNS